MKRSSTSEPPSFFTDRDLGRAVPEQLRAAGVRVEPYHKYYGDRAVPDTEWLRKVGENGWTALSHNKAIRYERDELDELMEYGVRAFFLIGRGPHTAFSPVILRAMPAILELIGAEQEPFAAKIFQSNSEVKLWVRHQDWRAQRLAHPPGSGKY